ncbi:hypothetical protein QSH57_013681 [Fusarium oxysporum f. sp. vasinfectum]|nr:hypothetical protein QSH57_013681 [Fusarium oxysporum f. sp. vasinfectum]
MATTGYTGTARPRPGGDVGKKKKEAPRGGALLNMEAGMDDIDDEERQAERLAKIEDLKEERLEKQLKAEKEARKRQALEAMRGRR